MPSIMVVAMMQIGEMIMLVVQRVMPMNVNVRLAFVQPLMRMKVVVVQVVVQMNMFSGRVVVAVVMAGDVRKRNANRQ